MIDPLLALPNDESATKSFYSEDGKPPAGPSRTPFWKNERKNKSHSRAIQREAMFLTGIRRGKCLGAAWSWGHTRTPPSSVASHPLETLRSEMLAAIRYSGSAEYHAFLSYPEGSERACRSRADALISKRALPSLSLYLSSHPRIPAGLTRLPRLHASSETIRGVSY